VPEIKTNRYETVYILRPTVSEGDSGAISGKISSVISKFKGKVEETEDWGVRDLSYSINKFKTGRFNVVVYNGTAGVVQEIERHFKISDDVIRYLTVGVESDYDYKKVRKQITTAEEEYRKNREARRRN